MRFIFCANPLDIRQPDTLYATEVAAVEKAGAKWSLVSFEALVNERSAARAVRGVEPAESEEVGIYRGWMLKPEAYARLYNDLLGQGIRLINTPEAYQHCHYIPESYSVLEGHTPRTVWLELADELDIVRIMDLLRIFGSGPVIVKDYVKSRKHEWREACYISSASDRIEVERVVRKFITLQGEDLNKGLVFREFVELEPLTTHTKSGMPLSKEYRLFCLDGQILTAAEYWEEGDYQGETPPIARFQEIIARIQSRFFTLDVARKRSGEWLVVEPGDGQVAGLPARIDVLEFYQRLRQIGEALSY